MIDLTKHSDEILRMAAIAAVYSMLTESGSNPGQIARQPGLPWSQDHRRMNMGMSSLMHARSSRSPWK
ncbi:MAG: hypothetical protein CMA63_07635 [Euryarchaeota archaeon]|nr:hypothetical protein [Euryarchaeota archaeon]